MVRCPRGGSPKKGDPMGDLEAAVLRSWPPQIPSSPDLSTAVADGEALLAELRRDGRIGLRDWRQSVMEQGRRCTAWRGSSRPR